MKKIIIMTILVMLCGVVFVSCGNDSAPAGPTSAVTITGSGS